MTEKLDINVGEIYKTDSYGDVEVLEYINYAKVKIRFKDTGSERYTSFEYIRSGKVRDLSLKSKARLKIADEVKSLNKKTLVGREFTTRHCGKCKVIDYMGWDSVVVEFLEPKYITTCQKSALTTGYLNNPLYPSVMGKGYRGVGRYGNSDKEALRLWNNLLKRVFDSKCHVTQPTYRDTSICDEWLNFQNFAEWCYTQKFFNMKDEFGKIYCLDKDLLVKGNKIYSPETCRFIPNEVNVLFTTRKACRGKTPIGVSFHKKTKKFQASLSNLGSTNQYLGLYETPEEAFQAYKTAKESYIKDVAEKWKGKIDDEIYDSMLEYEVFLDN